MVLFRVPQSELDSITEDWCYCDKKMFQEAFSREATNEKDETFMIIIINHTNSITGSAVNRFHNTLRTYVHVPSE